MAEYLIQDTTLDAIADAINAKTGGSSAMTPAEMVTEIGSIQTGGGGNNFFELALQNQLTSYSNYALSTVRPNAFKGLSALKSIDMPQLTILQTAFANSSGIEKAFFPLASIQGDALSYCPSMTVAVVGQLSNYYARCFYYSTNLETVDIAKIYGTVNDIFSGDSKLNLLILRQTTVAPISNGLLNPTCFKNGGSGGIIYIPKILYDHLGDGTSLDYKAATNWSLYESYGTITWAQIEGSQYEHYYADGTPIPTT